MSACMNGILSIWPLLFCPPLTQWGCLKKREGRPFVLDEYPTFYRSSTLFWEIVKHNIILRLKGDIPFRKATFKISESTLFAANTYKPEKDNWQWSTIQLKFNCHWMKNKFKGVWLNYLTKRIKHYPKDLNLRMIKMDFKWKSCRLWDPSSQDTFPLLYQSNPFQEDKQQKRCS